MIEAIGISATICVLISFLMKDAIKIRIINIFGASIFIVYGFLISSPSVWILNLCLVFIHIYFLYKYHTEKK